MCIHEVRGHLPAALDLPEDALDKAVPLPIDGHEGKGCGVVEPWNVENCRKALMSHGCYAAGGTLFWLTLTTNSEVCLHDAFSFGELHEMSKKLQLLLGKRA